MAPADLKPKTKGGLLASLRASFLTGLIVVAPAALTIWLIRSAVEFVDGKVLPLVPKQVLPEALRELSVPGLGLIIFFVFTLVVGWFAKGLLGRSLIRFSEQIVARMPIVRSIYNASKQIFETIFTQSGTNFSRAALVQYPRPGYWAVAFVASDAKWEIAVKLGPYGGRHLAVFIPTTPNPTSGFLLYVPETEVVLLDMTIEDAAKLIISAGLVIPEPKAQKAAPARGWAE